MMRMTLGLMALVFILAAGCAPRNAPEDPPSPVDTTEAAAPSDTPLVSGEGTITFIDLEGGFYGLQADDGTRYDPLNLEDAFREDGLRVRFRARPRPDVMTIRQWGRAVELLEIARIDGQ